MRDDTKAPAEWASIATIREWPKNPKPHPDRNVAAIARSIARFGFIDPVTVWRSRGWIAAGHGRARAAALLMREDAGRRLSTDAPGPGMVPVRFVEFASEAEFAAYAIADNRLTEANPMDGAAVADILQEIADAGGDVQIPGYEEADIAAMLADEPGADEWGDAMGGLPTEDRSPIRAMTFTLHDDQAATVQRAIDRAQAMGAFVDTGNENSNGNALARVCEMFLTGPGR